MELLPGFVSIPRLAGSPRPAGAFFLATVEAQTGPRSYQVRIEGRSQGVTTDLALVPGQVLRLRSVGTTEGRWVLQVLPGLPGPGTQGPGEPLPPLMAAFLARGLPAAADRLKAWAPWVAGGPAPADKPGWAAGLEARGEAPQGPVARALEPWLAWQQALEEGRNEPPPPDDDVWDLWNLRRPTAGSPWVVVPLRWEYQGVVDAGLLQARWNAPAQAVDRWSLTAAPAGVAFRLDARIESASLGLTWRFFRPEEAARWASRCTGWGEALSRPGLKVTLEVEAYSAAQTPAPRSVDVQA